MKKLISILYVIIILISTFATINARQTPPPNNDKPLPYIVELTAPSVVEYTRMIKEKMGERNILSDKQGFGQKIKMIIAEYKQNITNLHQRVKNIIADHLSNKKAMVKKEFFTLINGLSVEIPTSSKSTLEKLPFVKKIYPDYRVQTLLNVSIPLISVDKVWNLRDGINQNITGKNVTVAIVDTGVDYHHPDLNSSYSGGYDFADTVDINHDGDLNDRYNLDPNGSYHEWDFQVDKNGDGDLDDSYSLAPDGKYFEEDPDPMDDNGHGTHCAGILVGDGTASSYKYRGVAPDAKLYVYKALNAYGGGDISDIMAAIEMAVDPNRDGDTSDHRDIISLSVGVVGQEGDPDDILSQTVDNAVDAGVVVVVAAGNDGPTHHTIVSPACARKAITVGASTHIKDSHPSGGPDHIAIYSSRGPSKIYSIKPDVVAPGGDVDRNSHDSNVRYASGVVSTLLHGKDIGKKVSQYYTRLGGTSMACPHVAGVAALIKQKHPDWTPLDIKAALRYTAKDIGYSIEDQGFGRVDALEAVKLTTPPPAAFLYNINAKNDVLSIKGTATAHDLLNYTLYYKYIGRTGAIDTFEYPGNWVKICDKENKVVDNILYNWNTTLLQSGWYLIKLVAEDTQHRIGYDLLFTYIRKDGLKIHAPDNVFEGEKFNVSITNGNGDPVNGFIIFNAPLRIPKIRYADKADFRAYPILRNVESIDATVHVIVFSDQLIIEKKVIHIHNR
ncbi:MAG: hypothetical protein DRN01_04460 [Thermoplasmata archaeon]|nr:MAG: hypothetical protein DRN01_04460 [Thermoplasmata archaeon]